MADSHIDDDLAWQHLLRARHHDWRDSAHYGATPLAFSADGRWQSAAAVSAAASQLLDIMTPLVARSTPLVIAQFGQSLDGRIATECGDSCYVTGHEGLVHLHALRALVDAVLVGAGTVDADNPQLTVRHRHGTHPVRVVLDPRGRLSPDRFVFDDDSAATLHLVDSAQRQQWQRRHDERGRRVEVLGLEGGEQGVDPRRIVALLAERGLTRLLVEGGGLTISRFLQYGCLHRLHCMVSPMLIGSGRPTLTLPVIDRLAHSLRPRARHFTLGSDVLFDLDFEDESPAG
ncbi:RibD family protein [Kushneria aurantia]|uniref:RibD family protein n=1 Tax=Kushneria aurantia TaxID=504092 RepID=A0ABV6FYK4_9GAMM|nr:RibD family protein [Kushneria aurantia]